MFSDATALHRFAVYVAAFCLRGCTVYSCTSWCVCLSVNDPVKWQAALAVRVQPMVRASWRGGGGCKRVSRGWAAAAEGVWLRGRRFRRDSPGCHQTCGDPWVALSIPTWEACKWRGRAVIIYSPQLLTLDSELITEEGKSDRTWRVPEPVTLISVRCLQQGVREEELASVSFRCGSARGSACACLCFPARWGGYEGTCLSEWTMTQDDTWLA